MTKEQLDIEREKLFEEFNRRYEEIKTQAQKDGAWSYWGLDANEHLFKDLRKEMIQKVQDLKKKFEEEQG